MNNFQTILPRDTLDVRKDNLTFFFSKNIFYFAQFYLFANFLLEKLLNQIIANNYIPMLMR